MKCHICQHEETKALKGVQLCDIHYEWAMEALMAIKSRNFDELPVILESLPIRSQECGK